MWEEDLEGWSNSTVFLILKWMNKVYAKKC